LRRADRNRAGLQQFGLRRADRNRASRKIRRRSGLRLANLSRFRMKYGLYAALRRDSLIKRSLWRQYIL
jgi:hypothetical protein